VSNLSSFLLSSAFPTVRLAIYNKKTLTHRTHTNEVVVTFISRDFIGSIGAGGDGIDPLSLEALRSLRAGLGRVSDNNRQCILVIMIGNELGMIIGHSYLCSLMSCSGRALQNSISFPISGKEASAAKV